MMQQRFDRAFALLEDAVRKGQIPGGVLALSEPGQGRLIRAAGSAQIVPRRRAMREDTWFDLASLTKVIWTTPRILELAEAGVIDLDGPLTQLLPDLRQYDANAWQRKVTFRQCLGHQTPFPAVEPIYTYGRDADLLRAFVLQRDWKKGPAVYSDINFILLGLALERHHGKTLRQLDPGAGFGWSADPKRAAATENCTWRHKIMLGEVHDDNCYALEGAGHAGLFGTAASVLAHGESLLSAAGSALVQLQRKALSETRTHGWERRHEGWSGGLSCSDETIGHTGFTGTGLWIDFGKGRTWTLLTNRIHPTRHFDGGIQALRQQVGEVLSGADVAPPRRRGWWQVAQEMKAKRG